MNIDIVAVNVTVLALVFVPYILFLYVGQQDFRKINYEFKKEARKHALNIDIKGRWNLNAIGIDSHKQKLLFVQRRDEEIFVSLINLSVIQKCISNHHSEQLLVRGENEQVLQNIELELIQNNNDDKIILSLFNSDINMGQDYELKHAKKWTAIINNNLSINSNLRKVA